MGLVDTFFSKSTDIAEKAIQKFFEDSNRASQVASLVGSVQRGKKALENAQEAALKRVGLASSGDLKAAGKRLAQLRKSARSLDQKLLALQRKVSEDGSGSNG